MTKDDKEEFAKVFNLDCKRRSKDIHDGDVLELFYEDLEDISIEQLKYAAKCHRQSKNGMFALDPANVRKQLGLKNVQDLEWIDVVSMAKQKNTPLAIIASRYIKSHELQAPDIENRGAAEHFLSEMPAHIFRLENGEFTEHEITLCAKYGVNPNNGIHTGHSVLPNSAVLTPRLEAAKASPQFKLMLEEKRAAKNYIALENNAEGQQRVVNEIKKIAESIPEEKKPDIDNTAELKEAFNGLMNKAGK